MLNRCSRGILATFVSLLLCFVLSVFSGNAFADLQKIPELNSRVTDVTQRLNAAQVSSIEASLANLETAKGTQLAVLIINTTSPEVIEDYSLRVVEKWKLGRKNVDDGVLLLVALEDRKMRIEVGYGLEGVIPDIAAGRIIKEYIAPEFRRGNIAGGIEAGTAQIINLINGEPLPEPVTTQGDSFNDSTGLLAFMVIGSSFITSILVPLLGRLISVSVITVVGALVIWFISQNVFLTIMAVFLLAIFSMGFSAPRSSSYRDGGGYGGGFGGGGSSGGGFSGGGGGFGGGGASGGW